jgi:hypothetical protein
MKFNINSYVKVKLNKVGIDELKRQHTELKANFPGLHDFREPKTDEEGYSRFQLHDLMNRLGHLCTLGFEPPFDTEIEIVI